MRRVTSFLSGVMMGGLVGALLALLFTPASGEDLRSQVQDRVQQVRDEMRHAAVSRREELEGQLAGLRASGGGEQIEI